ncbi:MAG: hypothetical protein ACJ754_15510 [Pyrinomonadaceae bacterium]
MKRTGLLLENVASNSGGLAQFAGLEDDSLERDGGLYIRHAPLRAEVGREARESFEVFGFGQLFPARRVWRTEIPLTRHELFEHVEECRAEWRRALVDHEESANSLFRRIKKYPFQEEWDFGTRPKLLRACGGWLAVAGERLFYFIFENTDDPTLREMGQRLRAASAAGGVVLTITSESFFVPWGMLYTHTRPGGLAHDGSNFDPKGFWGYQHVIEHNTDEVVLETGIRPERAGPLPASMNFDETIDARLGVGCVKKQQELFERLERLNLIARTERRRRDELRLALEGGNFQDRILYFYCHGEGASGTDGPSLMSANLRLSDGEPITGNDIAYWLRARRELPSHPLVFINACQGGQMTTLFYQTIAAQFLRQKAVGLVGCQIDIPAPFAAEFARRLLSEFIDSRSPAPEKVRLGPLLNRLTRELMDVHHNPLGLVYSLYRGADCYIDRTARAPRA